MRAKHTDFNRNDVFITMMLDNLLISGLSQILLLLLLLLP